MQIQSVLGTVQFIVSLIMNMLNKFNPKKVCVIWDSDDKIGHIFDRNELLLMFCSTLIGLSLRQFLTIATSDNMTTQKRDNKAFVNQCQIVATIDLYAQLV